MTSLENFKILLPADNGLSESEIVTMRYLMDMQADMVRDSYIEAKANGTI
jgi:hypothetical protein